MKTIVELIESVQSILEAQYPNRLKLIKEFQDDIWSDESVQDEKLNEILLELAYDLDFYEPNKEWRRESQSYYNDDRLADPIKLAIRKLEEMKIKE